MRLTLVVSVVGASAAEADFAEAGLAVAVFAVHLLVGAFVGLASVAAS
jgi:hypothetical protein